MLVPQISARCIRSPRVFTAPGPKPSVPTRFLPFSMPALFTGDRLLLTARS